MNRSAHGCRGAVAAGLSALFGLGLLAVDLKPAAADPPPWAPAHGWRRKHGDDGYRSRYYRHRDDDDNDYRYSRHYRYRDDDDYSSNRRYRYRYSRPYNGRLSYRTRYRRSVRDYDGDGVRNSRDRHPYDARRR